MKSIVEDRALQRATGTFATQQAPRGWEYNPLYQTVPNTAGWTGGLPSDNGQPRFIPTEDYLRRYTTSDPNLSATTIPVDFYGRPQTAGTLVYDPRRAALDQAKQQEAQSSFDQFQRLELMQQLLARLGSRFRSPAPRTPVREIQIEGISMNALDPIRRMIRM